MDQVGLRALGLGPPVVEARAELALRSLTARERTAKFHVRNIIGKPGVADRRQAVERATGFVGEG